jgi:hypothetical protein
MAAQELLVSSTGDFLLSYQLSAISFQPSAIGPQQLAVRRALLQHMWEIAELSMVEHYRGRLPR